MVTENFALTQALALTTWGFHVFPCRPATKQPAVKWREASTTNTHSVRNLFFDPDFNIGIDCGKSGLVVIDPDMYKPGGIEDYEWFRSEYDLPATFTVQTASGGKHFYFVATGAVPGHLGLGPNKTIDVKSAGGYVLAPGSVFNGNDYILLDDTEPALLPETLSAWLTAPRTGRYVNHGQMNWSEIEQFKIQPDAYVVRELNQAIDRLCATERNRNNALLQAAYKLAAAIRAGRIAADQAERELMDAATSNGYIAKDGEQAAHATIRSAFRKYGVA